MNEHERIAWIKGRVSESDHLALGNGDDAAVVRAPAGAVISVDCQVENIHFRTSFADWKTLGRRAATAALSDLAAMAAEPRALFSSLVLPPDFEDADFKDLFVGILSAASAAEITVAGGNLSAGPCVMIDTTVVGNAANVVTRGGASLGDTIYVRGELGGAALGLQSLLENRSDDVLLPFIETWRSPAVDFDFALAGVASAAIDISDGLVQDLSHLCAASNVSASIDVKALPTPPGFAEACAALGLKADELALFGGEDYRLLFTAPGDVDGAFAIGRIIPRQEEAVVDQDARPLRGGFDHFRHESSTDDA